MGSIQAQRYQLESKRMIQTIRLNALGIFIMMNINYIHFDGMEEVKSLLTEISHIFYLMEDFIT